MSDLINSIYSLNYFYRKLKLAGPLYKSWIKRALDQNRVEVLESSGVFIGFMIFTELKKKPLFTLQKIFVDEKYCRGGYGEKLLNKLKHKATVINKGIQVRTSQNNDRAISFYKKNGFVETIDPIVKQKKYESVYLTWNP
jgi:ribosomal protein S18 acetylase RimI-like enzyme